MTNEQEHIELGPQPGPQQLFLSSDADIAIFGGAAGGGKTYALLLEPLRHLHVPHFGVVCFRRMTKQVRNIGGLWDESQKLYGMLGARPRVAELEWVFENLRVKFSHLEYDDTVLEWQGAQIPLIMFDELTHFSELQFWYMLSRLRSTTGIPGYVRATCNPDADSWVRKLIDWWIGEDGKAIYERSGVLRWFVRINGVLQWGDSKEELTQRFGGEVMPKSITFIPSKLSDNKILTEKDPGYKSNLLALSLVDQARLLGGDWNIRPTAGNVFRREWFPVVDAIPSGWIAIIRFWDRAATTPSPTNSDPDWTRGLKLYKYPDGSYVVGDLKSCRDTPGEVEKLVLATASHDTKSVKIMSQTDPGSAGKAEAEYFIRKLQGYNVKTEAMHANKLARAKPVSAQAYHRNISILRAPWNEEFFKELENFPSDGFHDDIVDTLSGAFNELSGTSTINYL